MNIAIEGGQVLLADGTLAQTTLGLRDGLIASLNSLGGRRFDAQGCLVLPGIVDLHGDAFERQMMPRPNVHFPADVALIDTDRQLIANGITTAYHGVTYSWEPGLRGADSVRGLVRTLVAIRPQLAADTRLHLRWETHALDAVAEIERWLAEGLIDLLAFNDHLASIERQMRRPEKLGEFTGRSGLGMEDFRDLTQATRARAAEVPAAIERLAGMARARGVAMASHDDESPEMRARFQALGCGICEFPANAATAAAALADGAVTVLGAPNVLRGGSHAKPKRLSASESVAAGLCSALTSDYFYPALLLAAFHLAKTGAASLARAWDLISAAPAKAVGLTDRGSIAAGRRADLIVVDAGKAMPQIVATFVAGRPVYGWDDRWQ
ncbi:MAG: alpha-D-ribose 1-methylphosphonate 5-triphosphate diphosphatase [Alphaproteobacteria bacterium]|nr:alpha-D-ribose 1-methylphosphonate 5-triphosphate diphosphatase [Alphaproteobacteria bacterium]